MLLDVFGIDLHDISTGEWILIVLALGTLVFAGWTAIVSHLVWRRPSTHIVFRSDWVIDYRSHSDFAVVEIEAEIAPLGSFMVTKATAAIKSKTGTTPLEPMFDQVGLALEGSHRLGFMFRLSNQHLPFPEDAILEAEVKLKDKSGANSGPPAPTRGGRRWGSN